MIFSTNSSVPSAHHVNMAVCPSSPSKIFAAYQAGKVGGEYYVMLSISGDGGETWGEGRVAARGGGSMWDPVIYCGGDGVLSLFFGLGEVGGERGGDLMVVRSEDGGLGWGEMTLVMAQGEGVLGGGLLVSVGVGRGGWGGGAEISKRRVTMA
ncbi:hypothetical protein TrRE_jg1394 [Triparma retinervis]|uniref:Sialidase domain-containing protein n=1 Tax=Triparma retinervis TaxID=2557542 RepID=A0A9W7DRR9_9STRA|nr:hypothetical protein TrRE_jg1394 [Triparma retinervis]